MLNVPKTVNALLMSASIREAEMLDWKAWMPEVFNLLKTLYKEGRPELKEAGRVGESAGGYTSTALDWHVHKGPPNKVPQHPQLLLW